MLGQIALYTIYYSLKWSWSGMLWIIGHKSTEQKLQEQIEELRNEISEIRAVEGSFILIEKDPQEKAAVVLI